MRLEGKVVLVTGGARGIGWGIAEKCLAEGAIVAIADIDARAGGQAIETLDASRAMSVAMDVSDQLSVLAGVTSVTNHFGRIDVLVNNAGWDKVEPFLQSEKLTWDRIIGINLYGVLNLCKAVLPGMVDQGYGKVVNISSDAGRVGSTGEAVYSAAKGGIIAFTKTLAREMARHQINVNCVCPGPADTALFAEISRDNPRLGESLQRVIPFRRLARPEDVANMVAFLASDEAAYITGQTISVSGGLTMV